MIRLGNKTHFPPVPSGRLQLDIGDDDVEMPQHDGQRIQDESGDHPCRKWHQQPVSMLSQLYRLAGNQCRESQQKYGDDRSAGIQGFSGRRMNKYEQCEREQT